MYAGGASAPTAQGIAAVQVPSIEGRGGWLVKNALDHVELLRNGRRESLSFPLNNSSAGSLQSNPQEAIADPLEQLSEMESDDLSQLRERMDALRQQMEDSGSLPETAEPTEQPTEEN